MNWQHPHKGKLVSVEETATKVRSGVRVVDPPSASASADLIRAIYVRWRELKDAPTTGAPTLHLSESMSGERPGHIARHSASIGPFGRKTCNQGDMDATSHCFSQTDRLVRNRIKPNVALMEMSPPDENSSMSCRPIGTVYAAAAMARGERRIRSSRLERFVIEGVRKGCTWSSRISMTSSTSVKRKRPGKMSRLSALKTGIRWML